MFFNSLKSRNSQLFRITGAGFETEAIIITTKTNESVAPIYDSRSLIIQKDYFKEWIADLNFASNHLTAEMSELNKTEASK